MRKKYISLALSYNHRSCSDKPLRAVALSNEGNGATYTKLISVDSEKELKEAKDKYLTAWDDALFMDVDKFRQINDRRGDPCNQNEYARWGHPKGTQGYS